LRAVAILSGLKYNIMLNSFGVRMGVALPLERVHPNDRVGLLVGGYWEGGEATRLPRGQIAIGKKGKL